MAWTHFIPSKSNIRGKSFERFFLMKYKKRKEVHGKSFNQKFIR